MDTPGGSISCANPMLPQRQHDSDKKSMKKVITVGSGLARCAFQVRRMPLNAKADPPVASSSVVRNCS